MKNGGEIAAGLTNDLDISRKIDRVRWLFKHYRERESWWTTDLQIELCAWLDQCKGLVDHRNDIIHGTLEWDRQNRGHFIRKTRRRSAEAAEIAALNLQFVHAAARVFDILYTFDRRFRNETSDPALTAEAEPETEVEVEE
jgi:hypothetical protein